MSIRIFVKQSLQQMVDNAVGQAYEKRKRSIDFLLLFPVSQSEKESITKHLSTSGGALEQSCLQLILKTKEKL